MRKLRQLPLSLHLILAMGIVLHSLSLCSATHLVILNTSSGSVSLSVEIAQNERERSQGLMKRKELLKNQGMLFIFDPPRPAHFWMKDTLVPLDMLFFDAQGKLVCLKPNARPHDLKPFSCHKKVAYVLEVSAGTAAQVGLQVGKHVLNISGSSWISKPSSIPPGTTATP